MQDKGWIDRVIEGINFGKIECWSIAEFEELWAIYNWIAGTIRPSEEKTK